METQKVAQLFTKNVPKGTDDAKVRQYGNRHVAGSNRAAPESVEQIYRSILGDVS